MKELRLFPLCAGCFLIFFGLSIFLDILFGVNIPVGRLSGGILLCFLGYYIIVGRHSRCRAWHSFHNCHNGCDSTTMGSSTIELDETALNNKEPFEYSTIMGNSIIDLTRIYPSSSEQKTKHTLIIDTVMGKTILKINKHCTFCIHAQGSLGSVVLPDGSTMISGSRVFHSHPEITTPDLEIHAHTVMGSLEVIVV